MGPDRLHPRAVAPILQIIFSKSLENGEVPDDCKQANIAPIFKKGERYCPSNYRPVSNYGKKEQKEWLNNILADPHPCTAGNKEEEHMSLTCVCSKLMEHII